MAFPLRLTANLALGITLRALGAKRNDSLIFNLAPNGNCGGLAASIGGSPIVWIGGEEPLEQVEIPSVANAAAASGRYVFLQTNGVLLRRRIHELQPLSQLFLTIRFDAGETAHHQRAERTGAFQLALEGIRAAKLSGFMICAQLMLQAQRDIAELWEFHDQLRNLDLDGFLISPATPAADLQRTVAAARQRLLEHRWAMLSRLLDSAILPEPTTPREHSFGLPSVVKVPPPSEESVQIR